jgi:hypothetical protein
VGLTTPSHQKINKLLQKIAGENIGRTDAQKNVEGKIVLQKKQEMTMYKIAGQCGDGGQRLERKSRG